METEKRASAPSQSDKITLAEFAAITKPECQDLLPYQRKLLEFAESIPDGCKLKTLPRRSSWPTLPVAVGANGDAYVYRGDGHWERI